MADEIRKLGGNGINREFLFLYVIDPVITYTGQGNSSNAIVPTPASGLGEIAGNMLSVVEKNSLDAGELAFETTTLRLSNVDLNDDTILVPQLQAIYAQKKTEFLDRIALTYLRTGDTFNEV